MDMRQILCFGDSKHIRIDPGNSEPLQLGTRWTSILDEEIAVLRLSGCRGGTNAAERLCLQMLTVPEKWDRYAASHPWRRTARLELVVLMLGTNDCKTA